MHLKMICCAVHKRNVWRVPPAESVNPEAVGNAPIHAQKAHTQKWIDVAHQPPREICRQNMTLMTFFFLLVLGFQISNAQS